jgi:hypothetical protein
MALRIGAGEPVVGREEARPAADHAEPGQRELLRPRRDQRLLFAQPGREPPPEQQVERRLVFDREEFEQGRPPEIAGRDGRGRSPLAQDRAEELGAVALHAFEERIAGEGTKQLGDLRGPGRFARVDDPEAEDRRDHLEAELGVSRHEVLDRRPDPVARAARLEGDRQALPVAEASGNELRLVEPHSALAGVRMPRMLGNAIRNVVPVAPAAGPLHVVLEDQERAALAPMPRADGLELFAHRMVVVVAVDDVGVDRGECGERIQAGLLEEPEVRILAMLLEERDGLRSRSRVDRDELTAGSARVIAQLLREGPVLGADLGDAPGPRPDERLLDDLPEIGERVQDQGFRHRSGLLRDHVALSGAVVPGSRRSAHPSVTGRRGHLNAHEPARGRTSKGAGRELPRARG